MRYRKGILLIAFFAVLLTSLLPINIYLMVAFSAMVWLMLPLKKWWNAGTIPLLLFSVFYTCMIVLGGLVESKFLLLSYLISPVAFYRWGRYLLYEYKEDKQRYRLMFFIVSAYLLYVVIMTVVNVSMVGIVNHNRVLAGIQCGDETLAATLYGLMMSLGLGCVGACFTKKTGTYIKIGYACLVVASLLTVIHLLNRGGLVILAVCFILAVLYNYRKDNVKLVAIALIVLIGAVFLMNSEFINGEILEAYMKRNDTRGYGLSSAGGRTELWKMSIGNLLTNPFGWYQYEYAHNLWLDMARIGGWVSLMPFLVVTVLSIKNIFFLLFKTNGGFAALILTLNISLLLAASIEPVIEGSILFFSLLLFIWGMTESMQRQERRSRLR